MDLDDCEEITPKEKSELFEEAKNAAYAIIEGKNATYYAIGAGCAQIVDTILHDRKCVMPVSHLQEGQYGVRDVCLSMPVVLGRGGILGYICPDITQQEKESLQKSASILKKVYKQVMKSSEI